MHSPPNLAWNRCSSKQEAINQYLFDVGPPAPTLAQHQTSIGSASGVCWLGEGHICVIKVKSQRL